MGMATLARRGIAVCLMVLMLALAGHIRSGDITGRILEAGVFPDYLSMTTSRHSGIGFFTTERFPLQDGFCSIQIREPNLCRAFHDWLTHLPGSGQVLGAEETAAGSSEARRSSQVVRTQAFAPLKRASLM